MTKTLLCFIFLFTVFSFNAKADSSAKPNNSKKSKAMSNNNNTDSKINSKANSDTSANNTSLKKTETAILAGGCFWGVEELIRSQPGVLATQVGYTGGNLPNPTYEIVKKGTSGHAESIEIQFDPQKTSYEEILKFFFKIHDPTTVNQQGNDRGSQYRSAIFFLNPEQEKTAKKIKELVDTSGAWKKPVVTEIVPASTFYSAETYHQDYLQKNPGGYTCHFVRELKF